MHLITTWDLYLKSSSSRKLSWIPRKHLFLSNSVFPINISITDPECLCYSPSTIAISALLLTFSKLRLNCREWLHCLPDECLPPKTVWGTNSPIPGRHPIFSDDEISYLNIDLCILALQRVQIPISRKTSSQSYTSPGGQTKEISGGAQPSSGRGESMQGSEDWQAPSEATVTSSDKVRMTPTSTADLQLWSMDWLHSRSHLFYPLFPSLSISLPFSLYHSSLLSLSLFPSLSISLPSLPFSLSLSLHQLHAISQMLRKCTVDPSFSSLNVFWCTSWSPHSTYSVFHLISHLSFIRISLPLSLFIFFLSPLQLLILFR